MKLIDRSSPASRDAWEEVLRADPFALETQSPAWIAWSLVATTRGRTCDATERQAVVRHERSRVLLDLGAHGFPLVIGKASHDDRERTGDLGAHLPVPLKAGIVDRKIDGLGLNVLETCGSRHGDVVVFGPEWHEHGAAVPRRCEVSALDHRRTEDHHPRIRLGWGPRGVGEHTSRPQHSPDL